MQDPEPVALSSGERRRARRLCLGFACLILLTFSLIVLGALVRSHEAGLACPDWPLCFGQLIPRMNLEIAFEWSHRALAGSVALCFAALSLGVLRARALRRAAGRLVLAASVLLGVQILLGALTVWQLLASWTVTAHLVTGNAFAVTLLLVALRLRRVAAAPVGNAPAAPAATRPLLLALGTLLALQIVLGGLVSSSFAGLACPEWPTCNGGAWFPSWRGSVGLHLWHRTNGYLLLGALALAAARIRRPAPLGTALLVALLLGCAQVVTGIANVMLALPVEVTGLHSALAAALVLLVAFAVHEAWSLPREVGEPADAGHVVAAG
jgi:cytochrome c oxidase assembly protein subunit 15